MATIAITGADQGLGSEFSRLYARDGHTVFAGCLDPQRAEVQRLASEAPLVQARHLDVTHDGSVAAFADALSGKPLDLLVNNAGVHFRKWSTPETVVFSHWVATLHVNTLEPARVSFALRESLTLAGAAKLVTISSDWGSVSNHPGTAYDCCSSKAAVNSVMRGLAKNWSAQGITVLLIHPGWMRTSMGGAEAPNLPADSVVLEKAAIDKAVPADNGRYIDTTGADMP